MKLKNIFHILLAFAFLFVSTTTSAADFSSAPDLEFGTTNPFVIQLQKLLNANGYVVNPVVGEPGSVGYESDYFGKLTQSTLAKFQSTFGLAPSLGYFGPKTKAKIDELTTGGILKNEVASIKSGALSANVFGRDFGYVLRDNANLVAGLGTTWTGTNGHIDRLYYNLVIDGYGGQPMGKCRERSQYITNATEKAKCAAAENMDLLRADNGSESPAKNLLIKNVTIKNAFVTLNAVGGTTATGIPNTVRAFNELPHTDTFQSYHGNIAGMNDKPEWLVIQDSIIKNSDHGSMVVGDTWWDGIVYQNLSTFCEPAFSADAFARITNDKNRYIGSSVPGGAPCGNQIGAEVYGQSPVWLINVSSGLPSIPINNPNRSNGAPVIVIGSDKNVTARDCTYANGSWSCTAYSSHPNKHRFDYIEDAIAAGYPKPPFVELSCSGWRTPPAGCETQQGYKGGDTDPNYYLNVTKSGNGSGTITSSSAGVTCNNGGCSGTFLKTANPSITLTVTPSGSSTFEGWDGVSCSDSSTTCTFSMNSTKSITATFSIPVLPFAIGNRIVVDANTGYVNVRSTPALGGSTNLLGQQANGAVGTISGGSVVADGVTWWEINYDSGVDGWSGQADNTGRNNLVVTEIGNPGTTFTLTANKSGTGASLGSISGNTSPYDSGETATVTANASSGASFTGWTGCASTSGTGGKICTVSMNGNKTVTANFDADVPPGLVSPTITSPTNNKVFPSNTKTVRVEWEDKNSNYLVRYTKNGGSEVQLNTYTKEYLDIENLSPGDTVTFWIHTGVLVAGQWSEPKSEIVFSISNVTTSTDDDGDGVVNGADRCSNTPQEMPVNATGCPLPYTSYVKIKDVDTIDLTNAVNLEVEGTFGDRPKIVFKQPINIFGTTNAQSRIVVDSFIQMGSRLVTVKPDTQFDVPATITFRNIPKRPQVKRNNVLTDIVGTYNSTTKEFSFDVDGFSTYSLDLDEEPETFSLTVNTSGNGNGTVTGNNSPYEEGEGATLTAVPAAGSVFTSWSGCTSVSGTSCAVSMDSNKTVTATFAKDGGGTSRSGGGGGGGGKSTSKPGVSCTVADTTVGLGSKVTYDFGIRNLVGPYAYKWYGTAMKLAGFDRTKEDQTLTLAKKGSYSLKLEVTDSKKKKAKVTCKPVKADAKYGAATVSVPSTGGNTTLPGNTGPGPSPYVFLRDLTVGSRGADVRELQRFLNQMGFAVASDGDGSLGKETEYFGPATANALARFQASIGIVPASGFFGPVTREWMK